MIGKCLASAALLAAVSAPVSSMTVGTPYVYGNLHWSTSISAAGLTSCGELLLDAMGDLSNSTRLMFYGTLNCGTGGYNVAGSGYLAVDGSIVITLTLGAGVVMQCPRLVNFGGLCAIYNSAGFQTGSASLVFR